MIDQANLTGESRPVRKSAEAEDEVYAGTVNCGGGYLEVLCSKVSSDSTVAKMVALVEQAHLESSPTEQRVKKVAKYYTPLVVGLAFLFATVPWAWGRETGEMYTKLALFMLITACPCALVIILSIYTYVHTYMCKHL